MPIRKIKFLIALSQIGRIWSKNRIEIKILQSITAFSFLALFISTEQKDKDKDEINTFNNSL